MVSRKRTMIDEIRTHASPTSKDSVTTISIDPCRQIAEPLMSCRLARGTGDDTQRLSQARGVKIIKISVHSVRNSISTVNTYKYSCNRYSNYANLSQSDLQKPYSLISMMSVIAASGTADLRDGFTKTGQRQSCNTYRQDLDVYLCTVCPIPRIFFELLSRNGTFLCILLMTGDVATPRPPGSARDITYCL